MGAGGLGWATAAYDAAKDTDDELDRHEDDRLLYVACTRARDHLAVSLHHRGGGRASHASRLHAAIDAVGATRDLATVPLVLPLAAGDAAAPETGASTGSPPGPHDLAAAAAQMADLVVDAGRRASVGATGIADPMAGHEWMRMVDEDGDPVAAVDATARGRAVHAVLEHLDLRLTGDDARHSIDALARLAATAEGIPARAAEVATLAASAAASPTVRAAAAALAAGRRVWRELPIAAPIGDAVVEGFVDLLFEDGDGLVLVDYKTDAMAEGGSVTDRARLLAHHRLQLAAYAMALAGAVPDAPVRRAVLVVTTPGEAVEVVMSAADLAAAAGEVTGLLTSGS